MQNNEELVVNSTENVEEQATEELVDGNNATDTVETVIEEPVEEKLYTESEFNKKLDELIPKKLAKQERKLKKDYEKN